MLPKFLVEEKTWLLDSSFISNDAFGVFMRPLDCELSLCTQDGRRGSVPSRG